MEDVNVDTRTSLVFALVAATGSPLDAFVEEFSKIIAKYGYEPISIRLTGLLREHILEPNSITATNEGERIEQLMNAGASFASG